jgi:hypothetical protein
MIISEISREDLEAAREVASDALGNRLVFWEFESTSKLRHRVCMQVADIDGPGARRHSHLFYLGYGSWPRRSWFACGHAYGALFTAVYERNPHATIQTAFATYHDAREFLNMYQSVLDRNVGSMMLPIRYGDECTCEPDYIETDTIEGWHVGRGAAERQQHPHAHVRGGIRMIRAEAVEQANEVLDWVEKAQRFLREAEAHIRLRTYHEPDSPEFEPLTFELCKNVWRSQRSRSPKRRASRGAPIRCRLCG